MSKTSAYGSSSRKKSPATNASRSPSAVLPTYSSKIGLDLGQIEAEAAEMRVGEDDLHGEVALRGPDVDEALVVAPGKLRGDRMLAPWLMPVIAAANCLSRAGSA